MQCCGDIDLIWMSSLRYFIRIIERYIWPNLSFFVEKFFKIRKIGHFCIGTNTLEEIRNPCMVMQVFNIESFSENTANFCRIILQCVDDILSLFSRIENECDLCNISHISSRC